MTTPTNDHAIRFPRTAIIWIVCGSLVFSLLLFSALTLILLKILDNEEIHFAAEQGDVQGLNVS